MSVELAYAHHRAASADSPTVVMLGSLGSNRSMWDPQVARLSSSMHIIAVDLRGHGKSPVPTGPYSVADLAGDVTALLDSLGLDTVHVVGLSLGGAVAQYLAIHEPLRVQTLSLLCTSSKFGTPDAWTDRAATSRAEGTSALAPTVVARWFTPGLASRDAELVAKHEAMVANTDNEGYAACCEALAEWDSRADLGRICSPTLVIAGSQDPSTTPDDLQIIADGVVGSNMVVLDPAAHLANVEQAGAVNQLLVEHILGIAAGRSAIAAAGTVTRRAVLGDAHVDRSLAAATDFTKPFQDFISRTAWGDIWTRPGLDHYTRRLLTLAILTAVGNEHELDMHIRAALRAGVPADDLVEVFLHTAIYAGVPNSNNAFALGKAALADIRAAEDGAT